MSLVGAVNSVVSRFEFLIKNILISFHRPLPLSHPNTPPPKKLPLPILFWRHKKQYQAPQPLSVKSGSEKKEHPNDNLIPWPLRQIHKG